MIKIFRILLLLLAVVSSAAQAEVKGKILFNDNWSFHRVDDFGIDEKTLIKDEKIPTDWEKVSLPHTPRLEPFLVNDQWQGTSYYAKQFTLNKTSEGKKQFLYFEAAMNVADVWLNGVHLTSHLGGYLPIVLDITSDVRYGAENTLIVRLDNRDNAITGPKPLSLLDFNTYGGIYRNVWLIEKDQLYITDPILADTPAGGGVFISTQNVNEQSAQVRVKVQVKNEFSDAKTFELRHTIIDAKGQDVKSFSDKKEITAKSDIESEVVTSIEQPALWSPDSPNLYSLKTELLVNGKVLDSETTRFGVRDIVIKPEGLWLNGRKTFLRGVNRHQEYPYVGYALSDNAQRRDAYKIKQAGFDYVRLSHYPQSKAFLDACDEYGLFVLEPILGWQYFGDSRFEKHAMKSAREMIRRDRNHPSILAWELSINEVDMPKDFMAKMCELGREEFPYSPYVAGWIKDGYDVYIEARQHRHQAYPEKPLIVSEYGDWEYYAMNAGFQQDSWADMLQEERSSRQGRGSGEIRLLQQARNLQEAHNDNLSTHAFADGFWGMFDYNRGYAEDLETSGVMDIFRLPKFGYYFYKSQRSASDVNEFTTPMIHIASYWQPDVSKGVRVFSNCDEVELFLGKKSLGRHKPDKDAISSNLPHPPFSFNVDCVKVGRLEAVGYINGKAVVRDVVETAGKAEQIKLVADISGTEPTRKTNDLIFVYAYVQDKKGNRVFDYTGKVDFKVIDGDAEIVKDAHPSAEAGIAPILLKIGDNAQQIKIEARGENLKTDIVLIEVK